jgi:hypothetical protein
LPLFHCLCVIWWAFFFNLAVILHAFLGVNQLETVKGKQNNENLNLLPDVMLCPGIFHFPAGEGVGT